MPDPDTAPPVPPAPAPAAPAAPAVRGLHLQVLLHRPQVGAAWSASLQVPGATAPLTFAGLPELMAFLSRLDPPAPGRGLR